MKNLYKILLLAALLAVTNLIIEAQPVTVPPDSINLTMNSSYDSRNEQVENQNQDQNKNRNQSQNSNQQGRNSQGNATSRSVKQVRSARPDLSKSKGARPNITRPGGMPKGVGKPGGAGKKGGS